MNDLLRSIVCIFVLIWFTKAEASTPYSVSEELFPERLLQVYDNALSGISSPEDYNVVFEMLSECIHRGTSDSQEVCGNALGVMSLLIKHNQPEPDLTIKILTHLLLMKSHYSMKQKTYDEIIWYATVHLMDDFQKQVDFLKLELETDNVNNALLMLAEIGAKDVINAIKEPFKRNPKEINLAIAKDRADLMWALKIAESLSQEDFDKIYIRNLEYVLKIAMDTSRENLIQKQWLFKKMYQFKKNKLMNNVLSNQVKDELFYAKHYLKSIPSLNVQKMTKIHIKEKLKLKEKSENIMKSTVQ